MILIIGLIMAMVLLTALTAKMCDRVEDPKLSNEEDIMQELALLYSQKEDRLTKPVNTIKPESIDNIIARATQKAAEINNTKKGTDEDSHQSRMGGRDYPRDYSR